MTAYITDLLNENTRLRKSFEVVQSSNVLYEQTVQELWMKVKELESCSDDEAPERRCDECWEEDECGGDCCKTVDRLYERLSSFTRPGSKLNAAIGQAAEFQAKNEALREQLQHAEQRLDDVTRARDEFQAQVEQLQEEAAETEEDLEGTIGRLKSERDMWQSRANGMPMLRVDLDSKELTERIKILEAELARVNSEKDRLIVVDHQDELASERVHNEELCGRINDLSEKLTEKEQRLKKQESDLEDLRADAAYMAERRSRLGDQNGYLKSEIAGYRQAIRVMGREIQSLIQEEENANAELAQADYEEGSD